MYAITYRTFTGSFGFFFAIAVFVAILETFVPDTGLGPSIVIYGMVALFSHRMVLFHETYGIFKNTTPPNGEKLPFWAFLWRYGALMVAFTVLMISIAIFAIPVAGNTNSGIALMIVFALLIALPALGFFLAKWGTVFPAVVASGDASMRAAARRSKGRVGSTFTKLALGPFAVSLAVIAVYGTLYLLAANQTMVFGADIVGCLLGLIPTHMTAVILSQLYQDTEGTLTA